MSRAYRISVKDSVTRRITGSDEISTRLELLEILPPETMADLLKRELAGKGYREADDGTMVKSAGDVTVIVDPCQGDVTVKAELDKTVTEQGAREGTGFDDVGPSDGAIRERLRDQLKADLENKIDAARSKLQERASAKLERELNDLQPELSEIVNRVTREALKQKAAQMGTIREVAEDPASGSMTITVEV
jgi:hypothetical protein